MNMVYEEDKKVYEYRVMSAKTGDLLVITFGPIGYEGQLRAKYGAEQRLSIYRRLFTFEKV